MGSTSLCAVIALFKSRCGFCCACSRSDGQGWVSVPPCHHPAVPCAHSQCWDEASSSGSPVGQPGPHLGSLPSPLSTTTTIWVVFCPTGTGSAPSPPFLPPPRACGVKGASAAGKPCLGYCVSFEDRFGFSLLSGLLYGKKKSQIEQAPTCPQLPHHASVPALPT